MTHISVNGDSVILRIGDIFRLGDDYWQISGEAEIAGVEGSRLVAENLRDAQIEYFNADLLDANNMYTKYSQSTR